MHENNVMPKRQQFFEWWMTHVTDRGSLKLCVVNTWADRRSNLIRIIYTITPSRHIGIPPEIFTVLAAIICTIFFIESWKKKNYWYHNGFYLLVPLLFHFVRCCKKKLLYKDVTNLSSLSVNIHYSYHFLIGLNCISFLS